MTIADPPILSISRFSKVMNWQSLMRKTGTSQPRSPGITLERWPHPLKVICYNIRDRSGGPGLHRGGNGRVREYELLCDASVSILSERRRVAPYGLAGGHSGKPGENSICRDSGSEILPPKVNLDCRKGDLLRISTPGGGGYGR